MYLPANTFLQNGKYRIIRYISSGGFGCTYEAEHVLLEERVAIKEFFVKDFCNRDETTSHITVGTLSKKGLVAKLQRKFIDEARALRKLHHAGIVNVQDVFEENGTAYYVMDYIDGSSLSDIVREQGPLSEERAVRYICQVASALQYVHDNNRLHLDIKPGNIMIDGNDNPILIDFGASKQYDEADGENTSTLLGKTPGYAPLEQMSNSVVKFLPATDIYALGATLYKLLTGVTPPDSLLRGSGEELKPLPLSISTSTRNAVTAALQMNKTARPQSLSEFLKLLQGAPVVLSDETTELNAAGTVMQTAVKTSTQQRPLNPAPQVSPKLSFWDRNKSYVISASAVVFAIVIFLLFRGRQIQSPQELVIDSLAMIDSTKLVVNEPVAPNNVNPSANKKKHQTKQTILPKREKEGSKREQQAEEPEQKIDNVPEKVVDDELFFHVEQMPTFQGGDVNTFRKWVARNVRCPQYAMENNISGRVLAQFVIEKDGSLSNIKILKTPDATLSAEVIRVLSESPKWEPGKQGNIAVRVSYRLPVDFRLQQ